MQGEKADSGCFPDDKGYYAYVNTGGKNTDELQDSDVVCFRAPADADGYHSLIQTRADWYSMPPLATVTLEKVEQPGEWEVCGHKVQRRLFTVRVDVQVRARRRVVFLALVGGARAEARDCTISSLTSRVDGAGRALLRRRILARVPSLPPAASYEHHAIAAFAAPPPRIERGNATAATRSAAKKGGRE